MQPSCAVRHARIGGGCDVCVSDSSADKTCLESFPHPSRALFLFLGTLNPRDGAPLAALGTCLAVRVPLLPLPCTDNASQAHRHNQQSASTRAASPPSHGRRPQRLSRHARWRPGHPRQGGPKRAVGDSTSKRPHPEGPCPAAGCRRDPQPGRRCACACAYGPGASAQCPRAL